MSGTAFIPYGTQTIEDDDVAAVVETLKSGYLTTGPKVAEFEGALCAATGAKYAVAVSSGTAALHLAALAAGLGAGDELITSPLTFAASANCALYCGAKPVFADVERGSMLLDIAAARAKITPATKVVVPVHYGGELCDMDAYADLAEEFGLTIIQDCAHSLGGKIRGRRQGAYPGLQIWSFHPVKTITTGEGGAVTTNDEKMYKRLLKLRTHGITRDASQFEDAGEGDWYYEMQELGYHYRLTDMQCALGISQLRKLNRFAARRQEIVEAYNSAFADLPVETQESPGWSSAVRHLYTVRVTDKADRQRVFDALKSKGIGVNVHYIPVYLLPHYRRAGYNPGLCPVAEDAYERLITLPLFPKMTDGQVGYVIDSLKEAIR